MEYRITSDGDYVYVIDGNGDQVAKFDMRLGYGQGATKGRRERNARKQADNWIKNKLASEELTLEEKRQASLEEDVEKFEERITEAGRLREGQDPGRKHRGPQTALCGGRDRPEPRNARGP